VQIVDLTLRLAAAGALVTTLALAARRIPWRAVFIHFDLEESLFQGSGAHAYDQLASWLMWPIYRRVAADVGGHLASGDVLDIGAGPGHVALDIVKRRPGLRVAGIDISMDMLGLARAKAIRAGVGDRARFEQADAGRLPFADRSFDLVVSSFSVHHWRELDAPLREIHRVLRPGGAAWLYDLWDAKWDEAAVQDAVDRSPFRGQVVVREPVHPRLLPVTFFSRVPLRRE
jgi:ubiquinone/menaquinone biosynthesis C-methylase UbiE